MEHAGLWMLSSYMDAGLYKILNYQYVFTLISTWMNNYTHYKVCDEITYPILNFTGPTIEVKEWMSNFIAHSIGHVINYPC